VTLLALASTSVEAQNATPPPPIFPKHRRGIYINSDKIEVIDATPQAPPLGIDDPGVPDNGEYEINLLTAVDLGADARTVSLFEIDANYGVVLHGWGHDLPTQIKLEAPVVARAEHGHPYETGVGTSAFGLKFNFYNDESRGLRMAVYPQIEFSPAGSARRGVAEAGQTLELPFLLSHESKFVTLVGNAGIDKPFHDSERKTTADIGFGAGRAILRKLALMGDIRASWAIDLTGDRNASASVGFIYGVRKAIWYGSIGHSIVSSDGRHLLFGAGMKLIID
jgi:hypothetical protein